MNWKLYSTDGEVVNTIVADEVFVAEYCEKHGYTFERMPDSESAPEPEHVPEAEPTADELMDILLGVSE